MENPYKVYKAGYAFNITKSSLVIAIILFFAGVAGILILPSVSSDLYAVFIVMILSLPFVILLNKYVYGIRIKMYQNGVWVYNNTPATMFIQQKPPLNDLWLRGGKDKITGSVILTYPNIVSVRRISDDEVKNLKKISNIPITAGINVPIAREGVPTKPRWFLLLFVSDYRNIVEITTREFSSIDPNSFTNLNILKFSTDKIKNQNEKILVSVSNPDDFIQEVNTKITSRAVL